jgi:peptidoglycan/LPS O-acetylase OafA/YrhL
MIKISRLSTSSIPTTQLLPGIHALRAVAALTILLFHLRYMADILPPPALQSTIGGHFFTGVILFFVLSAFSLAFSTIPTMSREAWVRDYLIKRFFRIAPLFYFMMPIYAVFFLIKGWAQPDVATWIMNITFLFNLVPGKHEGIVWASWTIGIEVLFYAIFPVFLLVSSRRIALALTLIGGIAISISARTLIDKAGLAGDYGKFAFISSLGVFLTGFVSFKLFQLARKQIAAGAWRPWFVKFACAAVGGLCLIAIFSPFGFTAASAGRPDLMVWSLLFGATAIWQALFPSRWFATPALQWVGERSYSIYLLHPLVIGSLSPLLKSMYVATQAMVGNWAFFVVAGATMLLVLTLANLTYHFIERPGMRAGKRLLTYLRKHAVLPSLDDGTVQKQLAR